MTGRSLVGVSSRPSVSPADRLFSRPSVSSLVGRRARTRTCGPTAIPSRSSRWVRGLAKRLESHSSQPGGQQVIKPSQTEQQRRVGSSGNREQWMNSIECSSSGLNANRRSSESCNRPTNERSRERLGQGLRDRAREVFHSKPLFCVLHIARLPACLPVLNAERSGPPRLFPERPTLPSRWSE